MGLYPPLFATSQQLPCGAVTSSTAPGRKRCTSFGFSSHLRFVSLRWIQFGRSALFRFGGFGSDIRLQFEHKVRQVAVVWL